jgi:hypothetical protein
MAKMKVKMVRLGDLRKGDFFWSHTSGMAYRNGEWFKQPRIAFRGKVLVQTRGGVKVQIEGIFTGKRIESFASKDRRVFMEVDNG